MKKSFKTLLTGICMGIADLVPGVSGGTIAFMSGIYEELISSLGSFNRSTFEDLMMLRWKSFWKKINGNFLLALFIGMGVSILAGARLLQVLLERYPHHLALFFVGMIVCSALFLFKNAHKESSFALVRNIGIVGVGVLLGIVVTTIGMPGLPLSGPGFIIAGVLGSLAMLLPGISGSYILLIVGMYEPIINAVGYFSEALTTGNTELLFKMLPILISVGVGVIIGILVMSKVMKRLLKKRHVQTVLVLIGVMIGALPAIIPTWGVIVLIPTAAASMSALGAAFVGGFFMVGDGK